MAEPKNSAPLICPRCGSEDTRFLKKKGKGFCFDCETEFDLEPLPSVTSATNDRTDHPMRLFLSYGHPETDIWTYVGRS